MDSTHIKSPFSPVSGSPSEYLILPGLYELFVGSTLWVSHISLFLSSQVLWDSSSEAQVTPSHLIFPKALFQKPLFLHPLLVFVFLVPTLDLLFLNK